MTWLPLAQGMVLIKPKSIDIRAVLIGVGVILLLFGLNKLLAYLRGGKPSTGKSGTGGTASAGKSLSHGQFIRQAYAAGFSEQEAVFLERYARQAGVINPTVIFSDSNKLDAFLQSAYKAIEHNAKTEDLAEQEKSSLFAIREAAGQRLKAGRLLQSTHQLKGQLPLSMENSKGNHFSTILVRNDPSGLYIAHPKDAFGEPIQFRKGAKLGAFFYTGNHQGYQFRSKVARTETLNGQSCLVLAHSHTINPLPSRKFERTSVSINCRYYRVHVQVSGRGRTSKRVVNTDTVAIAGIITDISAGGMSLKTMSPLPAGEYVKVLFDPGLGDRTVWASIVRTNRLRNGYAMHLKFVKISLKTRNELHALVFGYL